MKHNNQKGMNTKDSLTDGKYSNFKQRRISNASNSMFDIKKVNSLISLIFDIDRFLMVSKILSIKKHVCKKNKGMNTINQFHFTDWSILVDKKEKNIIKKHETNVADKIGLILYKKKYFYKTRFDFNIK